MQRSIGACSWIFGGLSDQAIARNLCDSGLDGVEYNPRPGDCNGDETKRIFQDHGLKVFSLTPPDADIAHPDKTIRLAAIDTYYWLIDFAETLGAPVVSCHGRVGRIAPITTQEEEDALLRDSVAQLTARAAQAGKTIAFEVLNRYETHQIRTAAEALDLCAQVNSDNLKVLLDVYHMNIEEADPARALRDTGQKLGLYHAADSNRAAPGRGHIDFAAQLQALDSIAYGGPIILEVNAPGPNPFTPDKGPGFHETVTAFLKEGAGYLRQMEADQAA